MPVILKEANIRPLLKKRGLDLAALANFRPVSNFLFGDQGVEKVVAI